MFPKRLLALTLFAALAVMPTCVLRAQWVSMQGPACNPIGPIISKGDTVLADVQWNGIYWNGLFHSLDGGATWFQDTSRFFKQWPQTQTTQVAAFDLVDSVLYATTSIGVLQSHNFGTSWDTVPGLRYATGSPLLIVDSQFFIGSSEGMGHYDAISQAWLTAPYPIRYASTSAIASIGQNIVVSVVDPDDDLPYYQYSGIYRSRDNGWTWDSINHSYKIASSIINYADRLYASIDSAVYRSDDSGSTWNPIIHSPNGEWVENLFPVGAVIFAILSSHHIVRSEDTLKTWSYVDSDIISSPPNIYIDAAHITASNHDLIAGTPRGIFLSHEMGSTWKASNQGLPSSVAAITYLDSQIFACNSNGLFACNVDSSEWSDRSHGLDNTMYISSLASNSPRLFAGLSPGISESSDQGIESTMTIGSDGAFVNGFFVQGPLMLCSSRSGVLRSTDSGTTWDGTSGLNNATSDEFARIDSALFVGTLSGIAVSLDEGSSWGENDSLFKDEYVYHVAANGFVLFADGYPNVGNGNPVEGFCRSFDGGTAWKRMDTAIFKGDIASILVVQNYVFVSPIEYDSVDHYVAGHPDVYSSSDNGTTWIPTGLYRTALSLTTDGVNLFAGTDSTVWRRPLSDFGISSVAQPPASTKSEIQIYPNPFSQSTEVTFTSQAAGYADVSIVNMLGVEVARLFSGELGAGEHSFAWDAGKNGYATQGAYECVVRMNGQVETVPVVKK